MRLFLAIGRIALLSFKGIAILLILTSILSGCGYRRIGSGASLPVHIHTIAIPTFQNTSLRYKVEQRFTAAVIDEFLRRARSLRITSDPAGADAVLTGTIKHVYRAGGILDNTGRNRVFEVVIVLGVTMRDVKNKKVMFDNQGFVFKGEYELSDDPVSFFNEDDPAVDRIARDFAQSLVTTILDGI